MSFVELLKDAGEIVKGKPTWKRFIDGTPLANDIAVWMADFAEPLEAERDRLAAENERLREALRNIADLRNLGKINPEVIAFAALAKKESEK